MQTWETYYTGQYGDCPKGIVGSAFFQGLVIPCGFFPFHSQADLGEFPTYQAKKRQLSAKDLLLHYFDLSSRSGTLTS